MHKFFSKIHLYASLSALLRTWMSKNGLTQLLRCIQEHGEKVPIKEVVMAVDLDGIVEIGQQISQIEEKNRLVLEQLERVYALEKQIQNTSASAAMADDVTQIQCIVDRANQLTKEKKYYLLLQQVELAISEIKKFKARFQKELPRKIFDDLEDDLKTHQSSLNKFDKTIKKLILMRKHPQKNNYIKEFVNTFEVLPEVLEGNLEFFPYHSILDMEKILDAAIEGGSPKRKTQGRPFIPGAEKYQDRLLKAVQTLAQLTSNAKSLVLSTQSAEAKAIERLEQIDSIEWETISHSDQQIDIERMNAWIEKRGYKPQIPCKDSPTC